jgi:alpha-beta hydrolase superfamily lysophospholipase
MGTGLLSAAGAVPLFPRAASPAPGVGEPRRWYELGIIGDEFLDGQLLRALEAIWHGMGDVGECLDTASRIVPGDYASHHREWYATAERVAARAWASLEAGHPISAGEAFLRASNYYRNSEFIDHDNPAARRHVETFQLAVELLGIPAEPVQIPYEKTRLPGYFFRAPAAGKRAPVLIAHSGFDGTPEEMKFVGEGAIKRGYHCLLFAGPGQGLVVREQGLPFRHDWERVVAPVVDFTIAQAGVDPERVALLGVSFGGFLAPRAAAFEPRLRALVANPGVLNFAALQDAYFGEEALTALSRDPKEFDGLVRERMAASPRFAFTMQDVMLKFGASTPSQLYARVEPFNNEGVVDRIRCPVLIMDGTEEFVNGQQAKALYDALPGPKDYVLFDESTTASLHCQTGALALSNQTMFDWLDDQLSKA